MLIKEVEKIQREVSSLHSLAYETFNEDVGIHSQEFWATHCRLFEALKLLIENIPDFDWAVIPYAWAHAKTTVKERAKFLGFPPDDVQEIVRQIFRCKV